MRRFVVDEMGEERVSYGWMHNEMIHMCGRHKQGR